MKHIVIACGLLLGVCASAQAGLLDPAAVEASRFVPPPPADGSADNKAEFAELKAIAARSTPAELAAAARDAKDEKPDLFNSTLGFDISALPETDKLLTMVLDEEAADVKVAKKYFHRVRPYSADPTLKTCEPVKPGKAANSYPSGHSTLAFSTGRGAGGAAAGQVPGHPGPGLGICRAPAGLRRAFPQRHRGRPAIRHHYRAQADGKSGVQGPDGQGPGRTCRPYLIPALFPFGRAGAARHSRGSCAIWERMNPEDMQAACALLYRHWADGTQLEALPPGLVPADRAEAYRVQALLEGYSRAPLYGWKIAATSVAGQRHIGVDGPLAGRILAERVIADGGACPLGNNLMKVAELEFAFRMARDLPPRDRALCPGGRAGRGGEPASGDRASGFPLPCISSGPGLAQLVADNACAHRFVLGPAARPDWRALDLPAHRGRMFRNGAVAEDGIGSNVLGDPRIALTWLANELSAPWRNAEGRASRHHRHLRQAGADRPGRPL